MNINPKKLDLSIKENADNRNWVDSLNSANLNVGKGNNNSEVVLIKGIAEDNDEYGLWILVIHCSKKISFYPNKTKFDAIP